LHLVDLSRPELIRRGGDLSFTPGLQPGDTGDQAESRNRFNGFLWGAQVAKGVKLLAMMNYHLRVTLLERAFAARQTVKTVPRFCPAEITGLKPGVNEKSEFLFD